MMLSSRGLSATSGYINKPNNPNPNNPNHAKSKLANNKRRALGDVTNASKNAEDNSARIPQKNARVIPSRATNENVGPSRRQKLSEKTYDRSRNVATLSSHLGTQSTFATAKSRFEAPQKSYQQTGQVDDIDSRDSEDPLCASEYVLGMYNHFREKELVTSVRPTYMDKQPEINAKMRAILVDWLIEVHLKYRLVPETLYLSINLIDRYLERTAVSRSTLQLVGVTCLQIASKYEEIYPPEIRDLVYICDGAYTTKEILEREETILKTLGYRVTIPSAHAFLVRYLKAAHADKKMVQLSCYILDGTLQSYSLLQYLPSQLAAAAVYIARRSIGRNPWSPTLLAYAGYAEEDIQHIAQAVLQEKNSKSSELRAIEKKYSGSRYGNVSQTALEMDF